MRFETDRPPSWQACVACGNELTEIDPRARCPTCGGLLEIAHRPPDLTRAELLLRFTERRGQRPGAAASGVWRFREFVLPSAEEVVSHPEGNTPLLHREALDRWTGIGGLLLKHEGHNPTGSFKDRGHDGRRHPGGADRRPRGRLRLHRQHLRLARGLCRAGGTSGAGAGAGGQRGRRASWPSRSPTARAPCWCAADSTTVSAWSQEASDQLGVYLLNSINPFRIEGQKTIVLELLQQLAWDPPDWIVLPAGNLGNTAAFGKALREAHAWGLIDRMPRLAAVQAAGAAPFARSFEEGFAHAAPGRAGDGGHRDPDRRPRLARPRGARDPGDRTASSSP